MTLPALTDLRYATAADAAAVTHVLATYPGSGRPVLVSVAGLAAGLEAGNTGPAPPGLPVATADDGRQVTHVVGVVGGSGRRVLVSAAGLQAAVDASNVGPAPPGLPVAGAVDAAAVTHVAGLCPGADRLTLVRLADLGEVVSTDPLAPVLAIPGIVLWDAGAGTYSDAGGTVPCGDGDPVYRWTARTGQHADAPSGGRRPTYRAGGGSPYLDPDGVDDILGIPSGAVPVDATGTVAFRAGMPAAVADGDDVRLYAAVPGGTGCRYVRAGAARTLQVFDPLSGWLAVVPAGVVADGGEYTVVVTLAGGSGAARVDGVAQPAVALSTLGLSTGFDLFSPFSGFGLPWGGRLKAVAACPTALVGADLSDLEAYLGSL